ncbi:hypothetical protein C3K47_06265 [Solitalea longa]|uniref:Putative auto-transporter adhesin head GIN domain-containing protein n=1 Tax=Solitalea longa TaxID=2079460 RepID=A0A2S5A5I5_9SPHI|nr:DUF2807 domain-containing protein [Solitalea longa]POY37363.1 hypothetical protein C3K47_06265 [Solitalea longa]
MKKMISQIFTTVAVVLLSMSTMSFINDENKTKNGEEIIKKEVTAPTFETIKVSGNFKVILTEGAEQKIVVEAPEKLTTSVKSFLHNGEFNVYTVSDVKKRITLHITLNDIRNISTFGDVKIVKN